MTPTPHDRPPLDAPALVAALDRHEVRWVLAGSLVLSLHGARLTPNDLDVVPDLAEENLTRVAACLGELGAVKAYLDGWGGVRGTLEACRAWSPDPATVENLDWLFVTPHGMLDIVVELAEPYETLMQEAELHEMDGVRFHACHPARVLAALEKRDRKKDRERAGEYARMRALFS